MEVSLIVAAAENGVIGSDNGKMPWRIRTDMLYFKEITMGYPVLVGRKTYETFSGPLNGRLNIIITRNPAYVADGCVVVHDAKAALAAAQESGATNAFIIGGGAIYEELTPYATTMYLTRVHARPQGNAHFIFDESEWEVIHTDPHPANAETKDQHPFTFLTLKRR